MKKSKVKLNGVKAVYHISPDVRVTAAFGRGNNSVLDKRIENGTIEELQNHSDIDVNISRKTYSFRKKSLKKDAGQFSVPDNTNDQLGIRTELEEEIFGGNFDDNIHIQAAYAVNDIIKTLSVAANLAETAINGLDRKNTENDIIGFYIIPQITYQTYAGNKKPKFDEFIGRVKAQGTFSYFPDILPKFKEESEEESDKEKLYYLMCIISLIRNSATHSKNSNSDTTDYIFGKLNSDNKEALTETADNLIKSKIDSINEGFSKNQKNNIYRLLKAGADTTENTARLIRRLYAFIIKKQDKNLGFSLKKLRECAIRSIEYMKYLPGKKYDTVRSKLYTLVDFVVYSYLKYHKEGKKFSEEMVDQLRAAESDEDKNIVYCQGAERLYNIEIIRRTIKALIKDMDIKSEFKQPDKDNTYYQPIMDGMEEAKKDFITTDQLSLFTKFIYVLCQFLDGKNINILLSSLISKFQQIEAFNGDIRKLNLNIRDDGKIGYDSKKYSIFEKSGQIADDLDRLRGVIKMDINDLNAYETMIKDALRVIGVDESDIESIYQTHFKTQDKKDSVSGFFRNNIINSRRFRYIIKYINPSDAYRIIQNEHVRNYVLGRMNDAIIDRYAHSVGIEDKVHDKRKVLSDILSKVKFDNFKELTYINPKDKNKGEKAKEREKPKAILGLYLTIVYIVVKSLVRINSQYVMAVYHLERDSRLCPGGSSNNPLSMTNHYCNNHLLKEKHIVKLKRYKLERYKKTQKTICTAYRNAIAHLSAVRKGVKYIRDIQKVYSYFGIYHYCMQKLLYSADEQPFAEFVRSIFGDEKELDKLRNGSYSQAILRALNYPFGYNPARYKNLSYEKIFMRAWQDEDTNKKT